MYTLTVYLKKKKFTFEAEESRLFNSFFEQLYSNDVTYVEFGNVTFDKEQFQIAVLKEKKSWLKTKKK